MILTSSDYCNKDKAMGSNKNELASSFFVGASSPTITGLKARDYLDLIVSVSLVVYPIKLS